MISRNCRADGGDRGGGWVRLHLEHATQEESALFADLFGANFGTNGKAQICNLTFI